MCFSNPLGNDLFAPNGSQSKWAQNGPEGFKSQLGSQKINVPQSIPNGLQINTANRVSGANPVLHLESGDEPHRRLGPGFIMYGLCSGPSIIWGHFGLAWGP